jgi:hypothetical protein
MRINLEFMTFQFLLILGEETIGSQWEARTERYGADQPHGKPHWYYEALQCISKGTVSAGGEFLGCWQWLWAINKVGNSEAQNEKRKETDLESSLLRNMDIETRRL